MARKWILFLLLSSSACWRSTPTGTTGVTPAAVSVAANPSVITAAEIQRTSASNAYDAILQVRRSFLATRGSTSFINEPEQQILVIVNGRAIGGVDELRHMPTTNIKSIKRLTAAEAHSITGRSAPSGAIQVVLRP